MARSIVNTQRDFSSGVLDFDARRRDDTKIGRTSLRRGTNTRPLGSGGLTDRPARRLQYFTDGRPAWARPSPGIRHKVAFGDGTFTARLADNTINTTLAGCPWTAAMLPELSVCMAETSIVVAHNGMPTQLIVYSVDDDEWVRFPFEFQEELSGEIRQPYYRFAAGGITMQPSGLTGNITLTFSDPVLVAGHVGTRFRYFDFEVEITAVNSATSANATVIRALPGTLAVTVTATAGFSEGDAVEGSVSGTTGVVASIVSSTVLHIVLETPGSDFDGADVLVGPTARSDVDSDVTVSPAAFTIWDEQLVSEVRGYPGGCNFDRARLMFWGFPLIGHAVLWGEVGNLTGFNIGALASDGMFETLPVNCQVQFVDGGSDQFIYTDIGVFYIPISAASPLQPGSIEFRDIPSDGAAPVAPARTMDGAAFINQNRDRILVLRATGQTAQPYVVEDISEYHRDLFKAPKGLALSKATGQDLVYVLNGDGTMVAGKLNRGEQLVGWFPWEGEGAVEYIAGDRGDILFAVAYDVGEGTELVVEAEDNTALPCDCIMAADDTDSLMSFAGLQASVIAGDQYLGVYAIAGDGTLTGFDGDASQCEAGFVFENDICFWVPNVEGGEDVNQRQTLRSIKGARAVLNSTNAELEFCGRIHSGYRANDDQSVAAPLRHKTIEGKVSGRSEEPEIPLRRRQPGRFKLVEHSHKVTI